MKLEVNLPNHPYSILIKRGALSEVGAWLSQLWSNRKVVIITDHHVAPLYAQNIANDLERNGFEVFVWTFLAGEEQKQLQTVSDAYDFLAECGMTRADGILALGGGVVGDLAGFVASTYMRGICFVQVPTSVTAQVDSSIGGKTGVNTHYAKNMIGSFAQPDGVLIDPDTLKTLGKRELVEGMGEVIKCALIADCELWQVLDRMSGDSTSILQQAEELIYRSCQVKKNLVVADERDNGVRLRLNFGHTIGHAIEQVAGYGKVMHGEAVAIGMVQISYAAERQGITERGLTDKIRQMCLKFGLPVSYLPETSDCLYEAISHDKKTRGSQLKLVLVSKVGKVQVKTIEMTDLRAFLEVE